jgi:hypothetical protein
VGIVEFLRARYVEARNAEEGKRRIIPSPFDGHDTEFVRDADGTRLLVDGHPYPIEEYQKIATAPAADQFVLDDLDAKLAIVETYATTARLRDEAAARIKAAEAAGERPSVNDLDTWNRAQREAGILEIPVRLLARPHRANPDFDAAWLED